MESHSFSLKFTPKAEEDLDGIYCYISNKLLTEAAADNLMDKIENSIMKLKDFLYSGSLVLDEPLKMKGYRKLIIENYIAFYLINKAEKQVVIIRVLYGASNYQNIL